MDVLGLFSPAPARFYGSLWLYGTTKGVWGASGRYDTPEAAEAKLIEWTGLPLVFHRERVVNGVTTLASSAYKTRSNLAVVTNMEGDVLSQAPLPPDVRGIPYVPR